MEKVKLLFFALTILNFNFIFGANSDRVKDIIEDVKTQIFRHLTEEKENPDRIFQIEIIKPSFYEETLNLKKQEILLLRRNTGLNLEARYRYNQRTEFFTDSDVPYHWRFFIGIRWDILQNGYFENKKLRELMEERLEVEEKILPYLKKQQDYMFYEKLISSLFIIEKLKLLEKNHEFYRQYIDLAEQLYLNNLIPVERLTQAREKYFLFKDNVEKLESQSLQISEEVLKYSEVIKVSDLPVFYVDWGKIKKKVENNPEKYLIPFQKKLVELQNSKISDITLSPFARYYFGDEDNTTRGFFAFGIEFEIPVPLVSKKNLIEHQKKVIELEYGKTVEENLRRIEEISRDYNREIENIIQLYFEREILREKITKELIKYELKDPSFSTLALFEIYSDFLDNELEILERKERIYRELAQVYKYVPDKNITEFFISSEIGEKVEEEIELRKGERFLYINSLSFNNYENNFIYWFLIDKKISGVIINLTGINQTKLQDFIEKAEGKISLYFDAGTEEGKIKEDNNLFLKIKDISGIERMQKEKGNKIVLVELKDKEKIKKIYPFVDRVFFKADQEENFSFIEKLSPEEKNKTGLFLNVNKYRDENELEKIIKFYTGKFNIRSFVFYSFADFLSNMK